MQPSDLIKQHWRLKLPQEQALERLSLFTLTDLLLYLPARYGEAAESKGIGELKAGDLATITGQIIRTKAGRAWKKKILMSEAIIQDGTGRIKALWFHQIYMTKKFGEGSFVTVTGKVSEKKRAKPELYFSNPEINFASDLLTPTPAIEAAGIVPIYPETRGLSSLWLYHANQKILAAGIHQQLIDPVPEAILRQYNLPTLAAALVWAHAPQNAKQAEVARKRFAFEEVFYLQLDRLKHRVDYKKTPAFIINTDQEKLENFLTALSFNLTASQTKAIEIILADLAKPAPMTRLLEGDVGSGKTLVAAATAAMVVNSGYEVAYLAPTEILARQHFESFIKFFAHSPIQIGLLTSSECRKFPSKLNPGGHTHISKSQLLKWVAGGQIPILIGTHALIQKTVKFKNLGLAVIDEQHRFGVKQRAELVRKNKIKAPHLLSMTATPIPRTLALTIYGDLDLTLLTDLPAGRRPVITEIVTTGNRQTVYEKIRQEIKTGRQAFVICPRINLPDPTKELALNVKSAKEEKKRLETKIFPELAIGLVHSKLKPREKEEVMADFVAGKIQILVATSVVEVGVNVPNATMIIIEGAERFGLAQLHQLRGRVARSAHQAYCFIFTSDSQQGLTSLNLPRLKALSEAKSGFELAELDLKLRGAGTLAGGKQWGVSDLSMEALRNLKMVEAARTEAQHLLTRDPDLDNHPLIKSKLETKHSSLHLE